MEAAESDGRRVRTLAWRRLDVAGLERCELWREREGWRLEGCVLVARPLVEARYVLRCDAAWRTRSAHVRARGDGRERELTLEADGRGAWRDARGALAELEGCLDVDLELSPCTNALPIRRLALDVGARAGAAATWVGFPELRVERLEQHYTRTATRAYRYESPGFEAELLVDELGFVLRYGERWERVAADPP